MPSDAPPPNYYAILEIPETASQSQIRDAYKRAALKTHPDRVPTDSPERAARTRKFQLVNDAYFTLSDATRRREYDEQRRLFNPPPPPSPDAPGAADPFGESTGSAAAGNAYSWAWNFFTSAAQNAAGSTPQERREHARQETEEAQFEDVFDEMMRDEGLAAENNEPTGRFWSMVGGLSGGALGFIVANVPGMVAGAVAGNRLGAVRDAKGKSVYAVFQELPADDKARLLSQLAAKVFSHAVGV